jgi:hypothetical protein
MGGNEGRCEGLCVETQFGIYGAALAVSSANSPSMGSADISSI